MHRKKQRRILHISRIEEGGVAKVLENLVTSYERDEYEPVVLFKSSLESPLKQRLNRKGIKVLSLSNDTASSINSFVEKKSRKIGERLNASFGNNISNAYYSLKSLKQFFLEQIPEAKLFLSAFRACQPDLIHTHHNTIAGKAEIIASNIAGLPCISHRHGYKKLSTFDILFSKIVSGNIYISHDIADSYIKQGENKFRCHIVHNGINVEYFKPLGTSLDVRKKYKLSSNEIVFGTVGRIDWWKGHEYFLKAFARVKKSITNAKAFIIGGLETNSSPERNRQYLQYLKELVQTLGISNDVIFTGQRDDIPRLLDALDVFVHASSKPEPFGLVIIEAMAMGIPVIATAAGGVLDIIEHEINGFLVERKDSIAIANAMLSIISDKQRAEQMGIAARQRVIDKFSIKQQVKLVQDIYESILFKIPMKN
jgi:glycosyltransferase involved in cell wall biosynthesis